MMTVEIQVRNSLAGDQYRFFVGRSSAWPMVRLPDVYAYVRVLNEAVMCLALNNSA